MRSNCTQHLVVREFESAKSKCKCICYRVETTTSNCFSRSERKLNLSKSFPARINELHCLHFGTTLEHHLLPLRLISNSSTHQQTPHHAIEHNPYRLQRRDLLRLEVYTLHIVSIQILKEGTIIVRCILRSETWLSIVGSARLPIHPCTLALIFFT